MRNLILGADAPMRADDWPFLLLLPLFPFLVTPGFSRHGMRTYVLYTMPRSAIPALSTPVYTSRVLVYVDVSLGRLLDDQVDLKFLSDGRGGCPGPMPAWGWEEPWRDLPYIFLTFLGLRTYLFTLWVSQHLEPNWRPTNHFCVKKDALSCKYLGKSPVQHDHLGRAYTTACCLRVLTYVVCLRHPQTRRHEQAAVRTYTIRNRLGRHQPTQNVSMWKVMAVAAAVVVRLVET